MTNANHIDHAAIVIGTAVSFTAYGTTLRGIVSALAMADEMPEPSSGYGYRIVCGPERHWCSATLVTEVHDAPEPREVVALFERLAKEGRNADAWNVRVPPAVMAELVTDESLSARYLKACRGMGL